VADNLFAIAAYAQEEGAAETAEEGDDSYAEKAEKWFNDRQEPVAFTSLAEANPCMLDGNYGWFKTTGIDQVWIQHTVSGCDIYDGSIVLAWAQIEDPDTPGNVEGFYCYIEFDQSNVSAMASADVETQTGTGVDYAEWNDIVRTQWCLELDEEGNKHAECDRQSVSQWQKLGTDAQTNYPISYDNNT